MSQGYGPQDPNQPGQGQQQQYGQGQYGQPPPAYPPPGYPPPGYPPAAPPGYGSPPAYSPAGDAPGTYMGRQLANWLQRVGAYLIDDLIGIVPVVAIGLVAGAISGDSGRLSGGAGALLGLAYLASFVLWIYNRAILAGRTGQSWGKKALNLRLVRMADGQPLGGLLCFVRDIVHVLDGICLIGYLFPLWDARRQTFADKIMNSVVLSEG
ncbi:MAG TPA: RDD family protein [Actinomycetota bacterium]|jgi:uncharacterized RDD family membrane protein YckC